MGKAVFFSTPKLTKFFWGSKQNNKKISRFDVPRYEFVRRIGEGAFSKVYRALDTETLINVAIKVMTKSAESDMAARTETMILKAIGSHPNVIRMISYEENCFDHRIILEEADTDLYHFIQNGNPLCVDTCVSIVKQIACGLSRLHELRFIHSDLKPQNVVVMRKGCSDVHIKLVDFGCAKFEPNIPILYEEQGIYITTRWYRSPEVVFRKSNMISYSTDIWSLGCIAYELLFSEVLFLGYNRIDMICWFSVLLGPPPHFLCCSTSPPSMEITMSGCDFEEQQHHYRSPEAQKRLQTLFMTCEETTTQDPTTCAEFLQANVERSYLFGHLQMTQTSWKTNWEKMTDDPTVAHYLQFIHSLLSYDPKMRPTSNEIVSHFITNFSCSVD